MTRMKKSLYRYGLMGLLLSAVFALFFEPLISGRGLYGGDFLFYFYPLKKYIREHLLVHGTLPFWNSYQFSGTPMISNIQASLLYPFGFLYYLISPERAYVYSTVMHCVMGAFFMYAFSRSLPVSRVGSFMAALVFIFNGYFIGHLYAGHLTFVQNYIWIPLVFLFLHRLVHTKNVTWAVVAGLSLGTQTLGGFPQIAFYTLLASALFVAYHAVILWHNGSYGVSKLGIGLAVCLVLGFCIAAAQILPTAEFVGLSTRAGGVSYGMATYESLHPKELLAFLIPEIYGNPLDRTYWRSRESWHFWESCGYVGILPLLLLFVKGNGPESKNIRVFFIFLASLALFLALGKYNPLYPLIYRLPGFHNFRIPAQIIFLYVFSVAVLSGIGLSRIMEGPWRFCWSNALFLLLAGGILVMAVAGVHFLPFETFSFLFRQFAEGSVTHANLSLLYGRMSGSMDKALLFLSLSLFLLLMEKVRKIRASLFFVVACALVLVDLHSFGAQFIRTYDYVTTDGKKHLADQLPRNAAEGRVVTLDPLFRTNDGLLYRFPSVLGYDPLILKRYVEFILASQNLPPNEHVVNLEGISNPQTKLLGLLHVSRFISGGEVGIIEAKVPYAHVVEHAVIKQHEEILPYLKSDAFDPRRTVVLEDKSPLGTGIEARQERPPSASVRVLSYDHEEIVLEASSNRLGYLVVSEMFYPGWYAAVDGRQTEIWRGNSLFRVIPLESGEHEVRLFFISWPFRIGAFLSLLSLGGALCFIVMRRKGGTSGLDSGSFLSHR